MYPEDKQKEVPYPMSRKNPFVMPILKWVGGKRQLLDSINPLIPECSTYYEPFIGGGAVLFGRQPNKAVINDSNEELINVYRMIKEEPEELIAALSAHKKQNCEEYYYTVRAWDRDKETYQTRTNVERAARIIYLNKTCYNGLFRVNSSGEFNSPWGRYKNPNITNEATIHALNTYLNKANITIKCGDYREALKGIRKGAFVYFGPALYADQLVGVVHGLHRGRLRGGRADRIKRAVRHVECKGH